MSHIKSGRTADQLQGLLEQTLISMAQNEKSGNYVDAETNRVASQDLKRDLQLRRVYEMEVRHTQEINDITKAHEDEMKNFQTFWDKKMQDFDNDGEKALADLANKHTAQLQKNRGQLEKTHQLKVKESSECLNLRKMQEHMVKQKNYVQAHKVQQRVLELEKQQKDVWMNNRNIKIQTALNTLRAKQAAEYGNLQKRIKTGKDEQAKDKFNQQVRLSKKFQNIRKQLKMQQDKQVLAFKGQFKSKGGQNSPMKNSKFLVTSGSK